MKVGLIVTIITLLIINVVHRSLETCVIVIWGKDENEKNESEKKI